MARSARAAAIVFVLALAGVSAPAFAQAPIAYELSFPEREHRLMHVAVTFPDLPDGPLQLRMSRSSPGRYAAHDFAKNVFDLRATDLSGRALGVARPNPHQWDVTGHRGAVRVTYRIFGDRVDGTYLAIDGTHAHINMPAALLWARGLERRPATIRFVPPEALAWRVATQLFPGSDAFTFTAPNLQYLLDSPAEVSDFVERTFTIADDTRTQTIRLALHHGGSDAEVDAFVRGLEAVAREARHVFGEYPAFEGGAFTFIADFLPWASGDGMEHRNSTVLTSPSSIGTNRVDLLNTAAHELLHAWNVERIRPRSLEPFDFEDANISSDLWFGEGFTSYYAELLLQRAGLTTLEEFTDEVGRLINAVLISPARAIRSAEEMSRMAPFVDASTSIDRTSFQNTYLSYYTWGAVIALGLDLTLRDRSDGRVTLDDYMRALWQRHGRPGGSVPGYVDQPYSPDDLQSVLADVAGDEAFARDFFSRYVRGHDVVDFAPLFERAGLVLRPLAEGRGFAGALRLQETPGGVMVAEAVPFGTPAYEAGLDRDDLIISVGGRTTTRPLEVLQAIQGRQPGEELPIVFARRGQRVSTVLYLADDPRRQLTLAERTDRPPDEAQRRFRAAWLQSAAAAVLAGRQAVQETEHVMMLCRQAACR